MNARVIPAATVRREFDYEPPSISDDETRAFLARAVRIAKVTEEIDEYQRRVADQDAYPDTLSPDEIRDRYLS